MPLAHLVLVCCSCVIADPDGGDAGAAAARRERWVRKRRERRERRERGDLERERERETVR